MPGGGKLIAIDISAGRLTAVSGGVQQGRLLLERCIREPMPEGLDPADGRAVGVWVRATLKRHRMHGSGVVVALERSGVVVKRLEFPGSPDPDTELPGMVRLAMIRQLALPSDGAAIDYLPAEGRTATSSATGVVAAALTSERMEWVRQLVRGSGLKLVRVTLRSTGLAAVLAERAEQIPGASLVMTFDGAHCEFMVMTDGQIVFSRHADLPGPIEGAEGDALAAVIDGAAREAKRSWVSYRMSPGSVDVGSVFVIGDPGWSEQTAVRVAEAVEMPTHVVHGRDRFSVAPERQHDGVFDGSACPAHWAMPLAGVLLEQATDRPRLNLARVWKQPDPRASSRKVAMLAALAALIAWGGAYTWFNMQRAALGDTLASLQERRGEVGRRYMQGVLASAQRQHLERWAGASPGWLDHLSHLSSAIGDDGRAIFGTIAGAADSMTVSYGHDRRAGGAYDPAKWASGTELRFTLSGAAKSQAAADALRGTFVDDDLYLTVPVGNDDGAHGEGEFPYPFTIVLTTGAARPPSESGPNPGAGAVEREPGTTASAEGGAP